MIYTTVLNKLIHNLFSTDLPYILSTNFICVCEQGQRVNYIEICTQTNVFVLKRKLQINFFSSGFFGSIILLSFDQCNVPGSDCTKVMAGKTAFTVEKIIDIESGEERLDSQEDGIISSHEHETRAWNLKRLSKCSWGQNGSAEKVKKM